ncbi:hypothetical protein SETIT_6G072400v2 [Setaria italica]|uniref:Uncharacterized protein n=1 Tax=Setaria italica TaxID=4555 RepID=A0A368RKN8_SETIT|nr:hypothetical protein SETIT_6G072400v2 [Setaria italica]
MASIGWVLLLFLAQLHTLLSTSIAHRADGGNLTHLPVSFLCHPNQAKALLQLKKSFSFSRSTTRLSSWQNGTDCCLWEGVGCDPSSGHVTILDLNNRRLSTHGLDPALFSLISLQRLDLSMNDIGGGNIRSAGFERFTFLTHLNLSNSGLYGQIPPSISKLVNLLSLDLSTYNIDYSLGFYGPNYYDYYNNLWESSFDTFVANLSNLRELYLDSVDLSNSGEEWGTSLAAYVPQLQILSLADCHLSGPIHKALSRLHSLVVIKLQENFYEPSGRPFPEFFMDFPNLTVLQLSQTNLEGRLPSRPFQSKNLRVLDLSYNMNLSGHVPNFSNASSLETLRLDRTNFVYAIPTPSSNFTSLKELGLNRNLISMDFLSAFGRLESLHQLDLDCFLDNELDHDLDSGSDLGPIFSWIGQHKNLTSLGLFGCNFSGAVGNLTGLQTLEMHDCNTYGSMPSSIGNLTNLRNLYILYGFSGPMPTAIGELTNLRNLYIEGADFSGPMPAAIGELTNLRNMYIQYSGFSGSMPAPIGNLTNLEAMEISGQISGLIPNAIGQLNKLRWLVLQDCNFSGSIPSSIVNLTQLTMLDLSFNSLNGEIPPSIFSLPILNHLDLSFNQLSGPIQGFDKAGPQLETVRFENNELSGFIPKAIFQLTSLVCIDVSSNNLIGSVDLAHFRRLTYLTVLHLSYNKLHVMASEDNNPVETSYLAGLGELGLASCKITQFPRFLRHVDCITYLDLSCNKISGDIPNWIWEKTWNVVQSHLNLSHNMFTGMQLNSDVVPFNTSIGVLDLSFNRLSGMIPMPKLSGDVLDYSNNMFSSLLPNWTSYLRDTVYLSISKNNIPGCP